MQKREREDSFNYSPSFPIFPLSPWWEKREAGCSAVKRFYYFYNLPCFPLLPPVHQPLPQQKKTVFLLPFPLPPTRPTPHFDYKAKKRETKTCTHTPFLPPTYSDVNAIKHNVVPRRIWEIMEGWLLYLPPLFPPLGTRSSHRSTENFFSSSFLLLETEERKLLSSEVGWCLKDREEGKRRENTPFVFTYPPSLSLLLPIQYNLFSFLLGEKSSRGFPPLIPYLPAQAKQVVGKGGNFFLVLPV